MDSLWTSDGPCGQRKNPRCPHFAHRLPTPAPNILPAALLSPSGLTRFACPSHVSKCTSTPDRVIFGRREGPIRGDPLRAQHPRFRRVRF